MTLFSNYITEHFSHVSGEAALTRRKKYLEYNYKFSFPKDKDANILEIGPGFGEMIEILRVKNGYQNVQGVDLSKEVVDHCNLVIPGSTQMVESTVEYLSKNEGAFDRIYMFHVLEHIPKVDCVELLKAIRVALRKEGRFLLEVPNMGNPLTSTAMRYSDFTHEIGFNDLSLAQVLRMAGFSSFRLFGPSIPKYSFSRALQAFSIWPLEFSFYWMLRLYKPKYRPIVTYNLGGDCTA